MPEKKPNPQVSTTPNTMMLRRTLLLLIVCGIVAFLVLAGRLFQLQILDHDFYETAAISQQVRKTTVTAARGTIYDSEMKILAMSASVDTIYISPKEIVMYKEDPLLIADELSEILGVDRESILEKAANTKSWYQTIARKVEPEISDKVREFKNEHKLKGVKIEEDTKRYYPYSSLASHVIGFVGSDNTGLAGIESHENEVLTGVNGRIVRAKNAVGTDMLFTSFEDYFDASNGYDQVLTINSTVQYYVEKHMAQAIRDYDIQNGGAAIVMDVETGAILAMASLGNFDLNNYQMVDPEIQEMLDQGGIEDIRAELRKYQLVDPGIQELLDRGEDEDLRAALLKNAQLKQWRNKAINDTYEPGSVFKIITLAMGLNEGVISPNDSFYCGGSIQVIGDTKPRKCWKTTGHGSQTLTQALQHSCNVAFIGIGANRVGAEKFYEYAEAFGFFNSSTDPDAPLTGKTGIGLGGESGSIWWSRNTFTNPDSKSQLAAASFGQTFNITPLQLITAVSACVNGGYLMKPYLVKEVIGEDGVSISKTEPQVVRQVISEETSRIVSSMLEQVVSDTKEGTGKNARVAGYRIGGKTGTSEKIAQDVAGGKKEYIVSFLGVAPMDDPKIAILVLLDTPGNSGVYPSGGQMGAPTVGKMFADILPYLGFQPRLTEDEQGVVDRPSPDLLGKSREEAMAKAQAAGLSVRIIGDGATLTAQLPAANTIVVAGRQLIVYCDAEPSGGMETVPDLRSMSYTNARQSLGALALYVRSTGPVLDPASVAVMSQSIAPGTAVPHGTVIEVSVADASNLGQY